MTGILRADNLADVKTNDETAVGFSHDRCLIGILHLERFARQPSARFSSPYMQRPRYSS